MTKPIPPLRLVRRTIETEIAYTVSRLRVLERLPGNPIGVAFRHLDGGGVALMARNLPVPAFNSVVGLQVGHARDIAPLAAWYRAQGVEPQFEAVPAYHDPAIDRALIKLGCFQAGLHASLLCQRKPDLPPAPDGVAIERVESEAAMEAFLDAYVVARQLPDGDQFKANVRPWREEPGWQLYVARADGRPAAHGILYVRDRVGYCADGATDPAWRGRGLQTALLRRRIADAFAAGADFVCGGAQFLSTSHRNMLRAGMRVQFVRALWR